MRSLIKKLADWSPNYHKTAKRFPKSSVPPRSMNIRARNNSWVTRRKLPCWLFVSLLLKILRILKYANWNILLAKEVSWNSRKTSTKYWKNQKQKAKYFNQIRNDVGWPSLFSHSAVDYLGWTPLPEITKMATMASPWKIETCNENWPRLNLEITFIPLIFNHFSNSI